MGWRVIVQGAYARAIGSTLDELRGSLVRYGLMAAGMVLAIVAGLWAAALRLLGQGSPARIAASPGESSERLTPQAPLPPGDDPESQSRKPEKTKIRKKRGGGR